MGVQVGVMEGEVEDQVCLAAGIDGVAELRSNFWEVISKQVVHKAIIAQRQIADTERVEVALTGIGGL